MRELLSTDNIALISAIEALLNGAHIGYTIADQNMNALQGWMGIFPCRVLVDDAKIETARTLLKDAGFAAELPSKG